MNTKYFVPQQVPEFILQKYPAFVEFIKAYYEWFEKEQISLGDTVVDVDKALDRFIQHFKNELDVHGVLYNSNNRLFLRRLKDLYKAKGSEASFDLFFKLVYQKPAEVFYPWDRTLKASDGKWIQESSIFCKIDVIPPEQIVGKNIFVQVGDILYEIFFDRFLEVKGFTNVFEFFIDRKWFKLIPGNAILIYNGVSVGQTVWTTSSIKIIKKGKKFKQGEIYEINHGDGSGSFIKVISIGTNGELLKCELIKFGAGYPVTSFTANIIPYSIRPYLCLAYEEYLNEGGTLPSRYDYSFLLKEKEPSLDEDFVLQENTGFIIVKEFEKNCADPADYWATLDVSVGAVSKYPGYFDNNDGIISDLMYIQDSYYYQVYSYVVQVDEQLKSYKNLLTKVIHPSGLALFGEYSLENKYLISTDLEDSSTYNIKRYYEDKNYHFDIVTKHFRKALFNDINVDTKINVLGTDPYTALGTEDGQLLSVVKEVECLDYLGSEIKDHLAEEEGDVLVIPKVQPCLSFLLQENGRHLLNEDGTFVTNDVYTEPCIMQEHVFDFGYVWDNSIYWDVSYHIDQEFYVEGGLAEIF